MPNETIFGLFQPLWTICRIVGIANRKLQTRTLQPKLRTKIFRYVYNIIVIYITCIITSRTTSFKISGDSITRDVSNVIWSVAKNLSLFTTIILSITNQENLQQVLRKLNTIDKHIRKMGMQNDFKNVKTWVISEMIGLVALLLSYFVFYNFLYHRNIVAQSDETQRIVRWCFNYMPNLPMHMFLMQFTTTVLVMAKQYAMVNRRILSLKRSKKSDKHLILSELQDVYTNLSKTKEELNNIYSLILLVKFWNQLCNVFIFVYHCIYGFAINYIIVKPRTVADYFVPLFASIVIFIEFGIIITVCEKMSTERTKIAKYLHQLTATVFDEDLLQVVSSVAFAIFCT